MIDAIPEHGTSSPDSGTSGGPEPEPLLSVIIVNYNVRNLLETCLHSLFSSLRSIPNEVIVVDNCSDDGSVDMIRTRFPEVRIFENDVNLGFARANNLALRHARGQFFWLLNPDTLVQEDTARTMLHFFAENPDVGMAGCKILLPSGELQPSCRRSFPSPWVSFTKLTGLSVLFPRSRIFGRYNLTYLNEDESYEVDAISGSNMMVRRTVYETVGGLDESYFMYGEDLDWCYQIQQSGWKVYYVHSTKIIHYSGESTRRSNIDAKSVFYEAMHLFARKNLKLSPVSHWLISLAIHFRLLVSRSRETVAAVIPVLIDALLVAASVAGAKYIRYGTIFPFPTWAYPTVYIVPIIVFIVALLLAGAYTNATYRYTRAMVGVLVGFFVLSSLTYFFNEYAFSRIIVLSSSGIAFVLVPTWRLIRTFFGAQHRISIVTGKPTLVVGSNDLARSIIRQIRTFEDKTYRIVGVIDINRRHLGEKIEGVDIVGSVDNIGKSIRELNVSDVIFAPNVLPYSDILTIISRTRMQSVHFRIVPQSLEFIIGKADIDQLTGLPLLDVECNLLKPLNRLIKRLFDITLALPGLITLYPFVSSSRQGGHTAQRSLRTVIQALPSVLSGRVSLVGHPLSVDSQVGSEFIDKPGLTGLAQLRNVETLSRQEIVTLSMQYARNYSLFLDIEILTRSFIQHLRNRNSKPARNDSNGKDRP